MDRNSKEINLPKRIIACQKKNRAIARLYEKMSFLTNENTLQ